MRPAICSIIILLFVACCSSTRAGSVVTDGSLGAAQTISPSTNIFTIPQSLGKTVGTNLFHSFTTLNLDSGQTASFTGASSIHNVFARVTGGAANIDGTIQCTIGGANFFLVDSSGVVFGPNAALNVSGSFAVTTADSIKFIDGTKFTATPSTSDALLSTAAPAAFGFLAATPAPIGVNGTLAANAGQALTVAGGAVTLSSAKLMAAGGAVSIVSVAAPGTVFLPTLTAPPQLSGVATQGAVQLTNSTVTTDGAGGGAIFVNGNSLAMTSSTLTAQTTGSTNGTGINVTLAGNLTATDSSLLTVTSSFGNAGKIFIGGQDISFSGADTNGETIRTSTLDTATGAGRAGDVDIEAASLALTSGATIRCGSVGAGTGGTAAISLSGDLQLDGDVAAINAGGSTTNGAAGSIDISAQTMEITNGAEVVAQSGGSGAAGAINLAIGGALTLDAGTTGLPTGIAATSLSTSAGAGRAGDITISAGSIAILNGASIDTSTVGPGSAGNITLNIAGDADLDGGAVNLAASGLTAESESTSAGAGRGGVITVTAGTLEVQNGANIDVATGGSGAAGNISITTTGALGLLNDGNLFANTFGGGTAGTINLTVGGAATIAGGARDFAVISTESDVSSGGGDAGNIALTAGSLAVTGGGFLSASTEGNGNAGNLAISVSGPLTIDEESSGSTTGILADSELTSAGGGNAGNISISAGVLSILNGSGVSTFTEESGAAGDITVNAASLLMAGGSFMISSALQAGTSGNIDLTIQGAAVLQGGASMEETLISASPMSGGAGGNITLSAGSLQMLGTTSISASTFASGNGGNININVTGAAIINGEGSEENAEIASKTSGAGNGGNVTVTAGDLQVINGGNIGTDTSGSGNSGNVIINANSLEMTTLSIISADTFSTGAGGNVTLNVAGPITMSGQFTSIGAETGQSTAGAGNGGAIVVNADALRISGQAEIDTSTIGLGNAGAMIVNVGSITINGVGTPANTTGLFADAASLTASSAGNGGDITIRGAQMSVIDGGQISTRSSDAGNGGDISINLSTLDMNGGDIESAAGRAGNAGNIAINVAGALTMENTALVLATSLQSRGGQIQANVGSLTMDFSGVTSQTLGTQPGGDTSINAAGNIQLTNGSVISAIAFDSDAGSITLVAGGTVELTRSELTTSAEGAGGNITIDPTYVILNDSFVVANAVNKNGGNILITPDVLLVSTDSLINASSQKGVSGQVEETAPDQDLAGQLVTLPGSLYAPQATLADICAVRLGGDFSSFITAPNGGLPLEPGGWLPSFTPGSNVVPQTQPSGNQ